MTETITMITKIKEEKIFLDPFSFMRKSEAEIFDENLKLSALIEENLPMTSIPSLNLLHIKPEPVDFDDSEYVFEERDDREVKSVKGRKRKRKSQETTGNARKKPKIEIHCPLCDYKNILNCIIQRHIKLHSLPGVIKCPNCLVLCKDKRNINVHMNRAHRQK